MVELVDTHGSGSCILTDVGVRVSPTAPFLLQELAKTLREISRRLSFKGPDSSVGRATDWKSVCRWFNSTSGHRLIISDISILSYIILVWFEELNKFYKVLQAEYWAINPQPSSTLVLQNSSTSTTPMGYPPYFVFLRERQSPEKNQGTNFTRICDFTWRVSDCEELVGVDQGAKYETLS